MRINYGRLLGLLGLAGTLAFASSAQAATTRKDLVILVDTSPSMGWSSKANDAAVLQVKLQAGKDAAIEWLNGVNGGRYGELWNNEMNPAAGTTPLPVYVQVWAFSSSGENAMRQVYPAVDTSCAASSPDCNWAYANESTASKNALIAAIQGIQLFDQGTPLAYSICKAIDQIKAGRMTVKDPADPARFSATKTMRKVLLVTDGGENYSANAPEVKCGGPDSTIATTFPFDTDSWQRKTFMYALNGTNPAAMPPVVPDGTADVQAWWVDYWKKSPSPTVIEVATLYNWLPMGGPAAGFSSANLTLAQKLAFENGVFGSGPLPPRAADPHAERIAPEDIAYFNALAKSNSGVVIPIDFNKSGIYADAFAGWVPTTTPSGKIPGDVDGNPCVDGADYRSVSEQEYGKTCAPSDQYCWRCDLNGDGYVGDMDVQLVIDHWGQGCVNPPSF